MTVQPYAGRAPRPSSLADVLELILDKGLVIDVFVRVSLVGIELLTIDARIVVASVDTFLRFAEATHRLDLYGKGIGSCRSSGRGSRHDRKWLQGQDHGRPGRGARAGAQTGRAVQCRTLPTGRRTRTRLGQRR